MQHIVENLIVVFSAKGRFSTEHDVHDNAHRPVVTLRSVAAFEHLWGNIVGRSVRCGHQFILRDLLGKPKVNQLDVWIIVLLIEQEVLWLNVSTQEVWLETKRFELLTYGKCLICGDSTERKRPVSWSWPPVVLSASSSLWCGRKVLLLRRA